MVSLAGMASESLVDDLRRMGRQLAPGYICAPTWVKLETEGSEERLRWGFDIGRGEEPFDPNRDQWRRVKPRRDLLQHFLKLADAPTERIEGFAKSWGVLGICQDHGLPISHQLGCHPLGFPLDSHEPISAWRETSRRLGAVFRIAKDLSADKRGTDRDWWTLRPHFKKNRPFDSIWVDESRRNWRQLRRQRELADARSYLRSEVDELLRLGDVGLQLEWQPTSRIGGVRQPARWVVRVGYGHWLNLFGALVVQLLLEMSGSDDVYICSGCKTSYSRDGKRPNSGENNWCSACHKAGEPRREADRRRREKMREARELGQQGVEVRRIAERLNTTPETVSGWLRPGKKARKT